MIYNATIFHSAHSFLINEESKLNESSMIPLLKDKVLCQMVLHRDIMSQKTNILDELLIQKHTSKPRFIILASDNRM